MFGNKLSQTDKIEFFESLAVLFNAGVPLLEALESLGMESRNNYFKKIIARTAYFIKEGQPLSVSLSKFPDFTPIHISLMQAGESSGKLPEVFANIVKMEKRTQELKEKVVSAMIYPIIVLSVMAVIMGILFLFVIPKVGAVFKKLNAELPLPTQILLAISDFINGNYIATIIVIISSFVTLVVFASTKWGRRLMFEGMNMIPIFRNLFHNVDLTNLSQTISLMLVSGIPILDTLSNAQNVVSSNKMKHGIKKVMMRVAEGKSLSVAFGENRAVFPSFFNQLVTMGEKSGTLDTILNRADEYYTGKVNASIKLITTLIEPLFLIILAVLVGGIIASIMAPIYQVMGNIGQR